MEYYPFTLMPLPYDYDALEPNISAETLHFHHDKHLATYVENLNKALAPYPQYQCMSLCQLVTRFSSLPPQLCADIRNNAGGVYNHQQYFQCLSPVRQSPQGRLLYKIEECFGSVEKFKEALKKAALGRFGSGYAWLVCKQNGQLCIMSTPNQDTPLPQGLCPLLLVDVWEHAYYLQYQNLRAKYFDAWFPLINWAYVEGLYCG